MTELGNMHYLRHMASRLRLLAEAVGDAPNANHANVAWHKQLLADAARLDSTATEVERMQAMLFLTTAIDRAKPQ